jgi:hypothetical protein
MGREYGGEERMEDTVDLPVAIEPVRPRRSIVLGYLLLNHITEPEVCNCEVEALSRSSQVGSGVRFWWFNRDGGAVRAAELRRFLMRRADLSSTSFLRILTLPTFLPDQINQCG